MLSVSVLKCLTPTAHQITTIKPKIKENILTTIKFFLTFYRELLLQKLYVFRCL
jgi:hypothetical protein